MQLMTLQQTADYLEAAIIGETIDTGHVLIHVGTNAAGVPFALVNDVHGKTTLT